MREPTEAEVEAYESVMADITAGKHYVSQCYILTCGGDTYDPCADAKEREER